MTWYGVSSHRTALVVTGVPVLVGVRGGHDGISCPYFENCTVDASIFVAKLVRAHGGCLGIRSR